MNNMTPHFFEAANGFIIRYHDAHNTVFGDDVMLRLGAYLPDVKKLDDVPMRADMRFDHFMGGVQLYQSRGYVALTSPRIGAALADDVYHLLGGALRKELLVSRLQPSVHAACVGRVDREGRAKAGYKLIMGHSGAGKTTLAQALIDDKTGGQDWRLFSGNKTVLDFNGAAGGITAIAGTKTMTALDAGGCRFSYALPAARLSPHKKVAITSVDIVRLNDGVKECEMLPPLSAFHTVYPFVMDQVNADVIVGGRYLFDGSFSTGMKQDVADKLGAALQHIPVRKIAGDAAYLKQALQYG